MNFKNKSFLSMEDLSSITENLTANESGELIKVLTKLWMEGTEQSELEAKDLKDCPIDDLCNIPFISASKYLSKGLDFTEAGMKETVISPFLKSAFERFKTEKLDEDLLAERIKKKAKKQSSMVEMINQKHEPIRLYIPAEDRQLVEFKGWFPLTTFEQDGAAFNLREQHINYLKEKFESYGIELESQFIQMFDYLRPVYKRKKFGHMNNFILNWISNHIRNNANSINKEQVAASLIDEFTKLIESNNGDESCLL